MAICGGELFMPKRSKQPLGGIVPGPLQAYSLDGEEHAVRSMGCSASHWSLLSILTTSI
jgi:hypothetical protein